MTDTTTPLEEWGAWEVRTLTSVLAPAPVPSTPAAVLPTLAAHLKMLTPAAAVTYLVGVARAARTAAPYPAEAARHPHRAEVVAFVRRTALALLASLLARAPAAVSGAMAAFAEVLRPAGRRGELVDSLAAHAPQWDSVVLPLVDHLAASAAALSRTRVPDPYMFGAPALSVLGIMAHLLGHAPSVAVLRGARAFSRPDVDGPSGAQLAAWSLLGPFLALGAWDMVDMDAVFDKVSLLDYRSDKVLAVMGGLRDATAALHTSLHTVVRAALSADKDATFEALTRMVAANRAKAKLVVGNPAAVCSDSLMYNLAAVFARLCERFRASSNAPLALVDARHAVVTPVLDLESETLLSATNSELEAWVDVRNAGQQAQYAAVRARLGDAVASLDGAAAAVRADLASTAGPSGSTRLFFLGLAAAHAGVAVHIERFFDTSRTIARLEGDVNNGPAGMYAAQINHGRAVCLATQALVLAPHLFDSVLNLYAFTAEWLLALLAVPADAEAGAVFGPEAPTVESAMASLVFPLPRPHAALAILPEYFLDDCLQALRFALLVSSPRHGMSDPLQRIVPLLMAVLNAPAHVKNPYLRARIAEVLFLVTPGPKAAKAPFVGRIYEQVGGPIGASFPASLMGFFVDVEATGGHSSFYDKFSVRNHVAAILLHMWGAKRNDGSQTFGEAFVAYASSDDGQDVFVKFVNAVMNDATFAVDESIGKFARFNELQGTVDAEELAELDSVRRMINMFMSSADDSIALLTMLASEPATRTLALNSAGLQARFARLLNHLTVLLLSDQVKALRVASVDEVKFERRTLLRSVAVMYGRMADEPVFIADAAADERNYSEAAYDELLAVLAADSLLNGNDVAVVERALGAIRSAAAAGAELDLSDAPDEYLDALTYEVMREPVRLPQSGQVLDRTTIVRQLLSDPTDPWTKTPLEPDDLEPLDDLRAEIEAWIAGKRAGPSSS